MNYSGICGLQCAHPSTDLRISPHAKKYVSLRLTAIISNIYPRPQVFFAGYNLRETKRASKVPPSICGRIRPNVEMSINLPRGFAQPELGSNFGSDLNASLGLDARYPSLLSSCSSLFCSIDHLQLVFTTFSAPSLSRRSPTTTYNVEGVWLRPSHSDSKRSALQAHRKAKCAESPCSVNVVATRLSVQGVI